MKSGARQFVKVAACWLSIAALVQAQQPQAQQPPAQPQPQQQVQQEPPIAPVRPTGSVFLRPYSAPYIPPASINNTPRLRDLIRAGILYLTAQDAIALALENDIDLEVARYNPIISAWNLERSEAGGALPGVPSAAGQAGSVANGQGVAGSQAAAGVAGGASGGGGGNAGNATISQIGPVTQTLDPIVQETTTASHTTTPQPNATQSRTAALVDTTRVHNVSLQQGFLFGGSATLSYSDHWLKENAVTNQLNPTSAPNLSISLQQNLLRGFGSAVGGRTITVSRINQQVTDLNFRNQVTNVVTNVLNQYYTLAADYQDLAAKRQALDTAQQFYQNAQRQLQLGGLSELDVNTAASQVASTQNDVVASETALQQDELQLKNVISRTGALDPILSGAQIVTLDRITIPENQPVPPLAQLVQQAVTNRPDLAAARLNLQASQISALGTKNGVLPSLAVIASASNAGLSGSAPNGGATPYFIGGIGTALDQVFSRDFPTERIGAFFQASVGNHQAEADYGIEQLQLRQSELTTQKSINQVEVEISNYRIALQQARARYVAAGKSRELQQELYDAEQRKFLLGSSTPYNVTQQERDLAAASATEIGAMATYISARLALDQAIGVTLQVNHVSLQEVQQGRLAQPSVLPQNLPPVPDANPVPGEP